MDDQIDGRLRDDFAGAEERYLREMLARLEASYREMAKPIIDRLVWIESCKPPRPIWLTVEQAKAVGFPEPKEGTR